MTIIMNDPVLLQQHLPYSDSQRHQYLTPPLSHSRAAPLKALQFRFLSHVTSDFDSPKEMHSKREGKASHKTANTMHGQGTSATLGVRDEELRSHNREKRDRKPDPFRFIPASIHGPTNGGITISTFSFPALFLELL